MLTEYELRDNRRSGLGCGITVLVIGMLIALLGCFWRFPSLTATTGVIVENRPLAAMWRDDIIYEYDAHGRRYRGERVWQYQPR